MYAQQQNGSISIIPLIFLNEKPKTEIITFNKESKATKKSIALKGIKICKLILEIIKMLIY